MRSNSFKCDFNGCEKSFNTKYDLRHHLRRHLIQKSFVCSREECETKCKMRKDLLIHMKMRQIIDRFDNYFSDSSGTESASEIESYNYEDFDRQQNENNSKDYYLLDISEQTLNVKDLNESVFKSIINDHNYCVKDSISFKNNEFESNPSNIVISVSFE
jgi:hypothetical protein